LAEFLSLGSNKLRLASKMAPMVAGSLLAVALAGGVCQALSRRAIGVTQHDLRATTAQAVADR
jgi:hypothetical protein